MAGNVSERLAIVGAGMASARLVHALVDSGYTGEVTIYGDEPHYPYNRVQLSAVLSGDNGFSALPMLDISWCQQHGIGLCLNDEVVGIDDQRQRITTAQGRNYDYDKLILATGSQAIMPSFEGQNLDGVGVFRTLNDVEKLIDFSQQENRKAVVVGGGLLGLEAAYGLAKRGVKVTLLNRGTHVMNRQLDMPAADMINQMMTRRGVDIRTEACVAEIIGVDRVEGVRLNTKEVLATDRVIFAIGISPNVALARTCQLEIRKGILVSSNLQTSRPNIFALGECTEFEGQTIGIVSPIWEQVKTLVAVLMGQSLPYRSQVHATQLKVSGIDVFSSGQFSSVASAADSEEANIKVTDTSAGIYRRLTVIDSRLTGAILLGDRHLSSDYEQIINSEQTLERQFEELMFSVTNENHEGLEI